MKATEQYFPVVPFFMLYTVVITFESVDELLKCDHLDKKLLSSIFRVLLLIMVYKVVLAVSSVD